MHNAVQHWCSYLYKRVLVLTYASINPLNIGNGTRQLFSPCSLLRDWYSSAGSGWVHDRRYSVCFTIVFSVQRVTLSSMAMEYYSISLMERGNVTMWPSLTTTRTNNWNTLPFAHTFPLEPLRLTGWPLQCRTTSQVGFEHVWYSEV